MPEFCPGRISPVPSSQWPRTGQSGPSACRSDWESEVQPRQKQFVRHFGLFPGRPMPAIRNDMFFQVRDTSVHAVRHGRLKHRVICRRGHQRGHMDRLVDVKSTLPFAGDVARPVVRGGKARAVWCRTYTSSSSGVSTSRPSSLADAGCPQYSIFLMDIGRSGQPSGPPGSLRKEAHSVARGSGFIMSSAACPLCNINTYMSGLNTSRICAIGSLRGSAPKLRPSGSTGSTNAGCSHSTQCGICGV